MVKWPLPKGSDLLSVTDLPRVELSLGNFHGYVKKKKNAHDSSRPKSYGLSKPQSGSTNHVAAIAKYRRSLAATRLSIGIASCILVF